MASTQDVIRHDDPLQELPPSGPGRAAVVDRQLERARKLRANGDRAAAVELVVSTLRAGLWRYGRLWTEMVSLMAAPSDYTLIRPLWWESPRSCHNSIAVLRPVARAAAAGGVHDDARDLLRKAIVRQANRSRRLRARLGRIKRQAVARLPRTVAPDVSFEQRAATALGDLNVEFDRLGVRSFLMSGTLLGFVRDKKFIAWDKDIDLGILTSEADVAEIERAFERSPVFEVRRLDFNTDRLRVNHVNGVMIDIFPHYEGDGDGRIWHDGTATRWWNTPFDLKPVEFLGRPQLVPDPPEKYLDENYGDWRTPNPHFDARMDTPNVEITDQAYFDTLLYFSLLDAIGKGNDVKKERYIGLLRELGEGDWLTRL